MTKIYVAGCGGMLGAAFHEEFSGTADLRCTDIDVNEEWLRYLDFRDFDAYRKDVLDFAPDYLFHLGALTDLEYCETHPDDAYATNAMGVENAVYIANELDIPASVHRHRGHLRRPAGSVRRLGRAESPGHLRQGQMGGGAVRAGERAHLSHLPGRVDDGRRAGQGQEVHPEAHGPDPRWRTELAVVDDKLGTPTYTRDFAHNVRLLLERGWWGLYNMVCQGSTSRLEVAQELVRQLGLATRSASVR